jgi:hypothetical protein
VIGGTAPIEPHLHHDHASFELYFRGTLEKLINFFLKQLSDLFVPAILAYRARDILNFNQLGLYGRSG